MFLQEIVSFILKKFKDTYQLLGLKMEAKMKLLLLMYFKGPTVNSERINLGLKIWYISFSANFWIQYELCYGESMDIQK